MDSLDFVTGFNKLNTWEEKWNFLKQVSSEFDENSDQRIFGPFLDKVITFAPTEKDAMDTIQNADKFIKDKRDLYNAVLFTEHTYLYYKNSNPTSHRLIRDKNTGALKTSLRGENDVSSQKESLRMQRIFDRLVKMLPKDAHHTGDLEKRSKMDIANKKMRVAQRTLFGGSDEIVKIAKQKKMQELLQNG